VDQRVWGIVLAGGGGNRFGGLKQFAALGGQSLLERVVKRVLAQCDGVVVVLPAGHDWPYTSEQPNSERPSSERPSSDHSGQPARELRATGGATRADSVRSGLAALPAGAGIVVITDAAHPLASAELYDRVIAAVRAGADGALPGLPLTDAIKELHPGDVAGATTPAAGHVSAQMPMAFDVVALRGAHERVADAVEDSAMVTADGGRVVVVPGEPTNVHVTTPDELAIAQALLPLLD
jgi:2-C-methyl-D-erythritol 4-phosphate cytidylyltransferase